MTIVPGKTPCLRCLIETAPPPGMTPTCETAGVLGPAVAVIASFEAVEAIKLLTGAHDALNRDLIMVDIWDWTFRQLKVAGLLGQGRLPLLQAPPVRVARRGDGLAHDHALRPQRRAGRHPPFRAAELPRDGRTPHRLWATSGTTRSCSGSPPRATSSPSSPTAGRSSREPTTSPRRGRFMRSLWGADSLGSSGRTMIYLDNAATSFPKPEPVYQALDRFARTSLANPGRAGHRMAVAAERMLDDAGTAQPVLPRRGPERWIFTLNCTDGLNLAIKGLIQPGDHVITTDLEHNSVSRPLRALEKAGRDHA